MRSTIESPSRSKTLDLVGWLADRGITIIGSSPDYLALDRSNWLANFLGDNSEVFLPMLRSIKRGINGAPRLVTLNVSSMSRRAVNLITEFGREAYRRGLFAYFHHDWRNRRVLLQLRDDSLVISFFTGGWFENYVLQRAVLRLSGIGASDRSPVLMGVKVRLRSGAEREIDILVGIGDRVLFFECKSGNNFPDGITQCHSVARDYLELPPERAGLVVLERLTADQKVSLEYLSGVSVVNVRDLDQFLYRAVMGEGRAA